MQGDTVAIEMLPEAEWSCPSSMIIEDVEEKEDEDAMKEVMHFLVGCSPYNFYMGNLQYLLVQYTKDKMIACFVACMIHILEMSLLATSS